MAYRDGRLFVDDFRVDVVTFITSAGFAGLIVGCDREHPVMRALSKGSAYFMNGLFRSCVMRSKALFAVLSDLAHSEMFAPNLRPALIRHIPWTRVVKEERPGTTAGRWSSSPSSPSTASSSSSSRRASSAVPG